MSATFSSANIDVTTGSTAATALSLTLARKRYAFEQHERIKKRRKQLNPVRLPLLEYAVESHPDVETSDTEYEKHINYTQQLQRPITPLKPVEDIKIKVEPVSDPETPATFTADEPSTSFKVEPGQLPTSFKVEPTSPAPSEPDPSSGDALPLNLTKNARIPDCPVKMEPKEVPRLLYSPRKEEFLAKNSGGNSLPAESAGDHFLAIDERKDRSPPFSPKTPPVMRNIFNAVTRTTCRIFNPEAFCNICNKEFCNKYFLKTHKANKHGVYCETKDSTVEAELPAVPLMFTWNVKNNNVKLPANPYLFNNAAGVTNTVKDSSAFCNICEKEFCNKYFLRRHKEKMHGIVANDSRKSETESEKSELEDTIKEEGKPWTDCRYNELTPAAKLKPPKNSSSDAVSDFIKICLTGVHKSEPIEGDFSYGGIKREVDLDNISRISDRGREQVADYSFKDEDSQESSRNAFDDQDDRLAPHTCEQCKKFLSTNAILRLHQKYVHALPPEEQNTERNLGRANEDLEFKLVESAYFMILKFSWLNTAVTFCEICQSEFDKCEALEMHLMNKHGALVDELSRIIEDASANGASAPALSTGDGRVICQICSKTFASNAAFQQHAYEKCAYAEAPAGAVPPEEGGAPDAASKSARNFCEICKKELCNKYFMKTHMRRMHGIAIQNGVRIGGVTCEICNKELCSKYFLRVHKKNCHGVMENVQQFARLLLQDCDKPEEAPAQSAQSAHRPPSQVCAVCGRIFKSVKWLRTHLLADHGKAGAGVWRDMTGGLEAAEEAAGANGEACEEEKYAAVVSPPPPPPPPPAALVYQCSRCQFQAASVELLLTHQRLHTKASAADLLQYRCLYCFVVTKDKGALEEHIAYHHFAGSAELVDKNEYPVRHRVVAKDSESLESKSLISVRKMDRVNT